MWIVVALTCALFAALGDIYAKKNLHDDIDGELVVFARFLYAVPVMWAVVIIHGVPPFNPSMFRIYVLAVPLEITAALLLVYAIHMAPISQVMPLLSFTPVFMLISAPIILQEVPNIYGVAGILLIVSGSYIVNISRSNRGPLEPFKMIVQSRGSVFMLIAAAIYSVTAALGKSCIEESGPYFFSATYFTACLGVLFIYLLVKGKLRGVFRTELLINGLLFSVMLLTHALGMKLVYASYMIAVKRTSILFSILLGMVVFKERDIVQRFLGGLIMVSGVVIISLYG